MTLSAAMCQTLRRMVGNYRNTAPAGTMDALQRRHLAVADAVNGGVAWRLTSRGVQVALLLGRDVYSLRDAVLHHTVEICSECGEPRDPRVMAWDTQDEHYVQCIECAVKGMGA